MMLWGKENTEVPDLGAPGLPGVGATGANAFGSGTPGVPETTPYLETLR